MAKKKKTVRRKSVAKRQRLTVARALRIKKAIVARRKKGVTLASLAEKFGVSVASISWINSERSHAHVKVAGWGKRGYNARKKVKRSKAA